jgi:hypothetical protein
MPLSHSYDAAWVAFHRVPYMWEPEFAADPNALARVASYQAGTAEPRFAPLCARLSGSSASSSASSHPGGIRSLSGASAMTGGATSSSTGVASSASSLGLGVAASNPPLSLAMPPTRASTAAEKTSDNGVTMQVPRGVVGRIIGSGGQNIRALEESTGAKVRGRLHL